MAELTFITGNTFRHGEVQRLLSGLTVHASRLALEKGDGETLEEIATHRVRDGFAKLGGRSPCAVENTGMYLASSEAFEGARFKRLLLQLGEEAFAKKYGGHHGITRVVVAYTADGRDVQLFEGQNEGELVTAPRGEGGYGWDRLWVPQGYRHTLAELAQSKLVVNMRLLPFLDLGAALIGAGFGGVFESHITVAPCDETAFAAACERLAVKFISIDLPRGAHPHQPMTGAHHRGDYRAVIRDVHETAEALARTGFTVVRTKLEAVGRHPEIPQTDEAAALAPKARYFEHHAKVLLRSSDDVARISAAFLEAGAHLSSSARPGANPLARFVTVRSWGVGQASADARFERVLDVARALGLELANRVREYTVFDSGLDVDAGWMA